jgi:arsenate reductase-like glutaredoxin family protein
MFSMIFGEIFLMIHLNIQRKGNVLDELRQQLIELETELNRVLSERAAAPQEDYVRVVREHIYTARQRRDENYLRSIFQKLKPTDDKITKESLIEGLKMLNVGPCLEETDDDIFHQYDRNLDGSIDFDEFRTAALRPSPLDSWCKNIPWWQAIADAIPRGAREIQTLRAVADLTEAQIAAICSEAEQLIRREFILKVNQLREGFASMAARSPDDDSAQPKFATFKANVGNCEDYHEGLKGRVGAARFLSWYVFV